ncbi:MAG: ABC transporter substrate-binding protein [Gammaproteobacteria bacterium]|nr:ABC transporter substrate-binding protein [Gammaproteobacteria bacterium]
MSLRLFLTVVPFALLATLLQALFWVPGYDDPSLATRSRLEAFIEGESGDAKLLNPILHADSQSGRIVSLLFDGLLDLDENLGLRGRLATHWTTREIALLAVDDSARLADGTPVDAATLLIRLRAALMARSNADGAPLLTGSRIVEGERMEISDPKVAEPLVLNAPPRIELQLSAIEPDLISFLEAVLGGDYAENFDASRFHPGGTPDDAQAALIRSRLPVLEHNPVVEFRLREGVRFHDGHPFTSEDVRFTYDAIMDPRNLSPRTSDFEPIKSVETPDPLTVRVVYKRLFSPAVNVWTIGILPAHLLNETAMAMEPESAAPGGDARSVPGLRDSRFNRAPVGTGPFRFREWQGDELIHLTRNEQYWDGPPEYREYFFRVIPDPLTKELEFRAGAIDTYQLQPFQVDRFRRDLRYRSLSGLQRSYTYIGYNNRLPLFSDPRVRRALGMAIDVDEIIRYVMYGEGERITGPYPKLTDWYDRSVAPLPYDPEGAERLLSEMGWRRNADGWLEKDGQQFEFNLITNHGNLIRNAILSVAQNSWRRIGIKVNTQVFEWAVFLEDFINPGRFDAVILGWLMGVDPDLFQIWHSSQSGRNQLNFVGYENGEADEIIERLRREYDRERQIALAHRLHRIIAEDQPYTFLYAPVATRVLDRKIVMVNPGGDLSAPRASPGGDVFFYMDRWRKLEVTPDF